MTGLRFAMVTTFYPPYHFGGDAVFIRRLTHALARRGHRVDVLCDVDAFDVLRLGERPPPLEEPEGVTLHPLESRFGRLSTLATQQTGRPLVHGRRIRSILESTRPDVIYFHNVSLVGGPGILRYGRALKLYMAHEHWLVCPSHVLWRHGRELCTGRQCLRCVLHYRRPPQIWRYTGLLERELHHVDAFVSPSAFSAAKHRELGFPRDLEVVPYFLPDPDSPHEREEARAGDASDRPYFLFVGRLERIKGLQDVIPHFGEDAPADLWVVGTGEFEGALREQASGLDRVRFLGPRTPSELRALYRRALAVVVPSVCYETFGIILLEAFREGTPVLARALGPFTEIVEGSGGGLLFASDAELGRGLRQLAADPALRERLGESGRRALLERWTESVVLRQLFALIRRVAEARGLTRVLRKLDTLDGADRLDRDRGHPQLEGR
ncbi:MAG: glycosyltransferase family 4 protein [Myxococcota bacterium]